MAIMLPARRDELPRIAAVNIIQGLPAWPFGLAARFFPKHSTACPDQNSLNPNPDAMTLHARLASLLLACALALPAAAIEFSRKPQAGSADALLPADAAFRLVSVIRDRDAILVNWLIEPGYYLYRQRIAVEAVEAGISLGKPVLPKGIAEHDEHFGDVEIYKSAVELRLPLKAGAPVPTQLRLRWQGCAEAGVCYPPVSRVVDVSPAS